MRIIGVAGRKGGSGKTTIAVHLAAELQARGNKVILIDADQQGSARHWAEPGQLPITVEHRPLEQGRSANQQGAIGAWSQGVRALKADYLVLDSPPHLDGALAGILGLADVAVIPCGPSGMDLMATAETVELAREIRDARKGRGKGAGLKIILVPNRADTRTSTGKELPAALKDLGELVDPEIHSRVAFVDAFNTGQWVGAFAPDSPAHLEMKHLADFVLKHLGSK